ncbi:MAG TPA: crosslink repair DNA glycosylase YcaQ family protein [Dictyobacter sp.]|jgi:uncharacterized protein YcaQ|nr:crosslink repair DNA glycosylase YcaQ family protein [Dictyobacter sp.]
MKIEVSQEEAQRFLATYHFRQTDLPGVIQRLGTVQYDPLNPVGRNTDLVFQARIPDYHVDEWMPYAYTERLIYDAWDKQACLVPTCDWAMRVHIREKYRPYHDQEILDAEKDATKTIFAEIDARGPLSSLDFTDTTTIEDQHTWYGQTRTKRILRSMWACGLLLTHHRKGGRHYFDRPERVIPAHHFVTTHHPDLAAYYRWIITRRHQATGLLRPTAEASIWTACGNAATRKTAIQQLVEDGTLTSVSVGPKHWQYYMPTSALPLLQAPELEERVILLGPLDSLLWDRKAILQLFHFDYQWEVYKPLAQRRWGYYVLPVFYGNRFIARLDSRREGNVWHILNWWWEDDLTLTTDMGDALRRAIAQFLSYLHADQLHLAEHLDQKLQDILLPLTQ